MQGLTQRPGNAIDTEAVMRADINTWVTQTDHNRAIKSAYGKRAYQIITNAPRKAIAFNLAVDQEAVRKIVDEVAQMKKAKRDREAPHTDLINRHTEARKKAEAIKAQGVRPSSQT